MMTELPKGQSSRLRSLEVFGYKSIRDLPSFPLCALNVLIGANGAGKSNFIGLFRLLNEMVEERLQLFVQTQGGPDALLHFGRSATAHLRAAFYFGDEGYSFSLTPTNDNRLVFANEFSWHGMHQGVAPAVGLGSGHDESKLTTATDLYSRSACSIVSAWRVYHFHDTGDKARVKQVHPANDNLVLKPDAANLAAYLRMLARDHAVHYRRIVDTIRLVAPFFDDFVHRPGDPPTVELEWTQKGHQDTPCKAHLLSDGTLRFICLTTLLLQPVELLPSTVLIDEPELGLHPYAITVLADMFKQVAEERQLIVSTQSVELVNELSADDVIVVDQHGGASTFTRFTDDQLSGWLKDYALGELWKRNVLGGRP